MLASFSSDLLEEVAQKYAPNIFHLEAQGGDDFPSLKGVQVRALHFSPSLFHGLCVASRPNWEIICFVDV